MARRLFSSIEALESRIAPASLTLVHPLPNITVGPSNYGQYIDLGTMFDTNTTAPYRTHVEFTTNFDIDPNTPGLQPGVIDLELFDDKTPLTVQNFLSYVNNTNTAGDYNNVIFSRLVQGFVLQLGGYDTADPLHHIVQGPAVHNEFNATDPELRPTVGTVALAKTGESPNSGTSEFFFNLADNSSNLDNQNGGFTVFGKVVSGLNVIQAIAQQPTFNGLYTSADPNNPNSGTPYQGNYDPNPDHNLLTPSPVPTANQFIVVTSAKVLAPVDSVSPNTKYEFAITDHGTSNPSTVAYGKIFGTDTLGIAYNKSATGLADVTVIATHLDGNGVPIPGDKVTDTFTVAVAPNIYTHAVLNNLQSIVGPGDNAGSLVTVTNNGGSALTGKFDINFGLFDATLNGSTNRLVGKLSNVDLNIPAGGSQVLGSYLHLPTDLPFFSDQTHHYQLVAQVAAHQDSTVVELYTDDDVLAETSSHLGEIIVGKVVNASNVVLRDSSAISYMDPAFHLVTANWTGPGNAQFTIHTDAQTHQQTDALDVAINGTTAYSNLVIGVTSATDPAGAHTRFNDVTVNKDAAQNGSAIGYLGLGSVDLEGNLIATGSLGYLALGDVLDTGSSHQILLGASAQLASYLPTATFGTVHDTTFAASLPMRALSATAWLDTGTKDKISAPGLLSLSIAGNLESDVTINANVGDARFISTNPTTTPSVGLFKVGGVLKGSTVKIDANMQTVDLGAIQSSQFLVGTDTVPTAPASFDQVLGIATYIVRGAAGQTYGISDSTVAARGFGQIFVGPPPDGTSGTGKFGFIADGIGYYGRSNFGEVKNVGSGTYDPVGNYQVTLV